MIQRSITYKVGFWVINKMQGWILSYPQEEIPLFHKVMSVSNILLKGLVRRWTHTNTENFSPLHTPQPFLLFLEKLLGTIYNERNFFNVLHKTLSCKPFLEGVLADRNLIILNFSLFAFSEKWKPNGIYILAGWMWVCFQFHPLLNRASCPQKILLLP